MHQDGVGGFSSLTKLFILKSLGTLALALECEGIFSAALRLVRCMKHRVTATEPLWLLSPPQSPPTLH